MEYEAGSSEAIPVRLPQKDTLVSIETLTRIEYHAKNILSGTILDQFPYYTREPDKHSSLPRLNCIDQAVVLKQWLEADPSTEGLHIDLVPFEADLAVYSPSQKDKYPFAHTALFLTAGEDKALGLVDPSFGIFHPLWIGETASGRKWQLTVAQKDGHPYLCGSKPGKQFSLRFYPEQPLDTPEAIQLHNLAFSRFMSEGVGSYTFAQSPVDGSKLASLDVNRKTLDYRLSPDSAKVSVPLSSSDPLPEIESPLHLFCEAVNRYKQETKLALDPDTFIQSVANFINLTRSLPPPFDLPQ